MKRSQDYDEQIENKKIKKAGTAKRESNDAYYTAHSVIDNVVKVGFRFGCFDGKMFVDFSAGDNRFAKAIKKALLKTISPDMHSYPITSFDINPSDDSIIKKDWFDVDSKLLKLKEMDVSNDYESCEFYSVGLNPPFGHQYSQIKRFMEHAYSLDPPPQFMMLIHPTRALKMLETKQYDTAHSEALPKNAFERPDGSKYDTPASLTVFRLKINEKTRNHERPLIFNVKSTIGSAENKISADLGWIKFTRSGKVTPDTDLVVRRTRVNFLRQAYVIRDGLMYQFVHNTPNGDDNKSVHNIDSEAFYKFTLSDKSMRAHIQGLATFIVNYSRNDDDMQKTPPSTTNITMNEILQAYAKENNHQ